MPQNDTLDALTLSGLIYTRDQTAELLGITPETLNRWRWSGRGPRALHLGKRVHYHRDDIVAWLDAQTRCVMSRNTTKGVRGGRPSKNLTNRGWSRRHAPR